MSAWVIPIRAGSPENWPIARDHGAWDLTKRIPIRPGDDLFFWLAPTGFVAWARASSTVRPISRGPAIPWHDRSNTRYVARVQLSTVSESIAESPRWGRVQAVLGTRLGLNRGPVQVESSNGIEYLRSLFGQAGRSPRGAQASTGAAAPDVSVPLIPVEVGYDHDQTDARRRVLSAVVQRRGQQRFRRTVLDAYGGACAITGSTAEPVLEAAHIDPYAGDHTQHVTNGLLLRSDLHTLFDLHLITTTSGGLLVVAPSLRGTEYARLERQRLRMPTLKGKHPDVAALDRHRCRCAWYATATSGRR